MSGRKHPWTNKQLRAMGMPERHTTPAATIAKQLPRGKWQVHAIDFVERTMRLVPISIDLTNETVRWDDPRSVKVSGTSFCGEVYEGAPN